jgi:hypothetical protein
MSGKCAATPSARSAAPPSYSVSNPLQLLGPLGGLPFRRSNARSWTEINHCACPIWQVLSDLSFDDYLEAGGWGGYAQKVAKDAFVTGARTWLEPLQKMLDIEQARLQALENTTADDFLLVVAIQRQLGTLKRYLKFSNTVDVDARGYQPQHVQQS